MWLDLVGLEGFLRCVTSLLVSGLELLVVGAVVRGSIALRGFVVYGVFHFHPLP